MLRTLACVCAAFLALLAARSARHRITAAEAPLAIVEARSSTRERQALTTHDTTGPDLRRSLETHADAVEDPPPSGEDATLPTGSVRGVLQLPVWGAQARRLSLDRRLAGRYRSAGTRDLLLGELAGAGGNLPFEFEDVPPGSYRLELEPLGHCMDVEVTSEGPVEVAFAVPPAIEFVIETVDATSGSAVAVPCIRWRQVRTDGVREARGAASRPSRCGAFRVRAPAGPLELTVGSRLYECEPVTLAPCSGDVVVLRVRGRRETAVR